MTDEKPVQEQQSTTTDEVATLRARVAELEAQLEKESAQATDYMKRWQYAQAELANVRRRGQQERDDLTKFAAAPLVGTLLEVLDNFERAEQTLPRPLQSLTWIGGVMLIHRQLDYVLQQHGVEQISTEGQRFDPNLHEAIAEEAHDSVEEGMVIGAVQQGYRLHGRVLRPALVRVSKGPAVKSEETATAEAVEATPAAGAEATDG